MSGGLRSSVLIPSRRPELLKACLESLAKQTVAADEVIVILQGEAREPPVLPSSRPPVRYVRCETIGIVPAENAGLGEATGDVILLVDDDATAPPDWIERHLAHYADESVGAVGGPAVNYRPDGSPFPLHAVEPIGRLTWFGRTLGNMHDHPDAWRARPPLDVDHLVGYNMSLRRTAFDRFEEGLRPYWQLFELDACLQVRRRGLRVLFDFANVVEHRPSNPAYAGGREGDPETKIYNAAFNRAFVLAKHSRWYLRIPRLMYLLAVGSVSTPGLLGFAVSVRRYGKPLREAGIVKRTIGAHLSGWVAGRRTVGAGPPTPPSISDIQRPASSAQGP
jgi:glycosyltransferase involved in cell wall biosynthesis